MGYNLAHMNWDLIGHTSAVQLLTRQMASGTLRQAYLLCGPEGVGRRTLGLRLAKALLCSAPPAPGAFCGACQACRQVEREQFSALHVLQAEPGTALKVDQVRALQVALAVTPVGAQRHVSLILRFEEATPGAQNALLKTLEEPNPSSILILTASSPEDVLPTVASRCETLRLRPLAPNDLEKALLELKEGDAQGVALAARLSGGRPGYALRLLREPELMRARDEWTDAFFSLLHASRTERLAFSAASTREKERGGARAALKTAFTHWQTLWRDALLLQSASDLPLVNADRAEDVRKICENLAHGEAVRQIRRLQAASARLPNASLTLMLDALLLGWPQA